jgi:TPR repeat protein
MHKSRISLDGNTSVTENYLLGGAISLGGTAEGKAASFIKSLDELNGSLFPLQIGNRLSVRYQSAYLPDRRFDSTVSSSCEIMNKVPASTLHPRLKGDAWNIRCQNSYTSHYDNRVNSSVIDDYYLEDLGLMLSVIGQLNFLQKKFILPQPGDQTVLVAEGEYGSHNTTTYISYDWSVTTEDQEKGKIKPSAQPASTAAASANWGLADQDFSIMTGQGMMEKVRMAERRADILAAAQAGDMVSQYLIGVSYDTGVGIDKDAIQKIDWITKAAEQGLVRARAALGLSRIAGIGTAQDDLSGWTLLMEASNAGNAFAQYWAAILTLSGMDAGGGMVRQFSYLKKSDANALLRRSADAGLPSAQYSLGHSYLQRTEFNRKDLKQARFWLEKAAAQNSAEAATALANMR